MELLGRKAAPNELLERARYLLALWGWRSLPGTTLGASDLGHLSLVGFLRLAARASCLRKMATSGGLFRSCHRQCECSLAYCPYFAASNMRVL